MVEKTATDYRKNPLRVLIIAGSNRRQYNCPGIDSKARTMMLRMAKNMPKDWVVDFEDLGNVYKRSKIQSCNACVSTSMALCVWPCNCYEKNNAIEPDLMWDLDLYSRLDQADAWVIIGPVNWYNISTNLKLMFDRLVCMNGGNPMPELINRKDPEMAMELEHSENWKEISVNHLEGRTAGFFCYGDGGGDEIAEDGIPKIVKHKEYFPAAEEPFENMRDAYKPLVWQCRYSGIEVPDQLWKYAQSGTGGHYSDNQAEDLVTTYRDVLNSFDDWTKDFIKFVENKGKVEPGKYRAFGYEPKNKIIDDIRLYKRTFDMIRGKARKNSSPRIQDELDLNMDTGFGYKKSSRKQIGDLNK